jgi:hypothetical protein
VPVKSKAGVRVFVVAMEAANPRGAKEDRKVEKRERNTIANQTAGSA